MSVRTSVRPCAKVMYTKTQERVCLKSVYWELKLPNARSLTKLEPTEIFNDFAISREPFDESDSNEINNLIFLSFKYVDKS